MQIPAWIRNLRPGDEVHWIDPDGDSCSRDYRIKTIEIKGEVICIESVEADILECFANEISFTSPFAG